STSQKEPDTVSTETSKPSENDQPAEAEPISEAEPPTEAERAAATLALQEAVAAGDVAGVRAAIDSGADLEVRGDDGRTPLVSATKANRVDIARALLEAGADPNAQDDM